MALSLLGFKRGLLVRAFLFSGGFRGPQVKFETFLAVIQKKSADSPTRSYWASSLKTVSEDQDRFMVGANACPQESIRRVWRAVCGEQDSMSYFVVR